MVSEQFLSLNSYKAENFEEVKNMIEDFAPDIRHFKYLGNETY